MNSPIGRSDVMEFFAVSIGLMYLWSVDRMDSIRGGKSDTCAIVVNALAEKLILIISLNSRTVCKATLRRHHSAATGILPLIVLHWPELGPWLMIPSAVLPIPDVG